MSSETKSNEANQQKQSSLEDILVSINQKQYLSQCKAAGLEENIENIKKLNHEQLYKELIAQNIPGISARIITEQFIPSSQQGIKFDDLMKITFQNEVQKAVQRQNFENLQQSNTSFINNLEGRQLHEVELKDILNMLSITVLDFVKSDISTSIMNCMKVSEKQTQLDLIKVFEQYKNDLFGENYSFKFLSANKNTNQCDAVIIKSNDMNKDTNFLQRNALFAIEIESANGSSLDYLLREIGYAVKQSIKPWCAFGICVCIMSPPIDHNNVSEKKNNPADRKYGIMIATNLQAYYCRGLEINSLAPFIATLCRMTDYQRGNFENLSKIKCLADPEFVTWGGQSRIFKVTCNKENKIIKILQSQKCCDDTFNITEKLRSSIDPNLKEMIPNATQLRDVVNCNNNNNNNNKNNIDDNNNNTNDNNNNANDNNNNTDDNKNNNNIIENCLLFDVYERSSKLMANYLKKEFPKLILLLESCHKQNIIHRDIQPSNILFKYDQNFTPTLLLNDWSSSAELNNVANNFVFNNFINNDVCSANTKQNDLIMAVNSIYFLYCTDPDFKVTNNIWNTIQDENYFKLIQHAIQLNYSELYNSIINLINTSNNNMNTNKRSLEQAEINMDSQ